MTRDEAYLRHILDAVNRIHEYTTEGRNAFMRNKMMQDAVIRNLEIIGEATKSLSLTLRAKNPSVPWSNMAAMRDVLIHNYMGVDLNIVWDVLQNRLSNVSVAIETILHENV